MIQPETKEIAEEDEQGNKGPSSQNDNSGCKPSQIKIKLVIIFKKQRFIQETEGEGASEKEIKDVIGDPSSLNVARVLETGFKTTDGRIEGSYLGTPGGDSGEFILGLQIFSEMQLSTTGSIQLTQSKVKNILRDYLQYMK